MRGALVAAIAATLVWVGNGAAATDGVLGVLFAVGDIAECASPGEKFKSGEAIAKLVQAEIDKAKMEAQDQNLPVAVLALGDIAYDSGEPKSFKCFDTYWRDLRNVLLPVPGNHEYEKKNEDGEADDNGKRHAKPFFDYFTDDAATGDRFKKTVKQNGDSAGYYFVNFPENADKPWRLVGLNSHHNIPEQVTKLKADLKATRDAGVRCVLAFSHAFFYSSGRHGHGLNGLGSWTEKLRPESVMSGVFQALYEGGASLLVSGHDHHYEQLGRANAKGLDKDYGKAAVKKDGVRSFIVGTGGTQLYSLPQRKVDNKKIPGNDYARKWAFQEAYNLTGYGVLKIELYEGFYKWQYVPEPSQPGTTVIVKPLPENKDNCNRP